MSELSFLQEMHAKFATPAATVLRAVERATGERPSRAVQVVNGYDNEVYRVDIGQQGHVFVRLRRNGVESFGQESWAMAAAREVGVPVPKVLLDDFVEDADGVRAVMVVEGATGDALTGVLPQLSPASRHATLVDLGKVVRKLHTVSTPGVWRPGPDGTWPNPQDLRRGFIADRMAERDHLVAAGLTPTEVNRTVALLGHSLYTPPLEDFVLCHGDLTPDHIFVDPDLHVTALIDWGMWHGGSAVGELAYLSSWAYSEPDLSALVEGYGTISTEGCLRKTLAVSLVNNLVGHVGHHVSIKDAAGTANVIASLRRALRAASNSE